MAFHAALPEIAHSGPSPRCRSDTHLAPCLPCLRPCPVGRTGSTSISSASPWSTQPSVASQLSTVHVPSGFITPCCVAVTVTVVTVSGFQPHQHWSSSTGYRCWNQCPSAPNPSCLPRTPKVNSAIPHLFLRRVQRSRHPPSKEQLPEVGRRHTARVHPRRHTRIMHQPRVLHRQYRAHHRAA